MSTKKPPKLTRAEINAVLGVLGDIDPAHFEGNTAKYEAAFHRAEKKLFQLRELTP